MSSPFMFESSDEESSRPLDDESSCDYSKIDKSNGLIETIATQEVSEEHKRVDRVRTLLMGVPPPPGVTVSQYSACEILQCFKENSTAFGWSDSKSDLLQMKATTESMVNGDWPAIRDQHWFNVSYNRDFVSEELALLTVKYQERYIGNETSSSVNCFFSKSPIRTASAKKRARRHPWGHSPGRRLSHLARRRHTFSSANLQQSSSKSQPDKKKMILVEHRKAHMLKKGRNSATKAPGSLKSHKPVSTVNTKRALFQSPENSKNSLLLSNKCETSPRVESVLRSKRALWPDKPDTNKENGTGFNLSSTGKRVAESTNSVSVVKKKCLKSLSFTEEKASCVNDTIPPILVREELSQLHKKKLLWAVSNALRKLGIGMEHALSKLCMSELFRICKELWLKKTVNEERNGSTSDSMLELANKFSSDVVRKAKLRLDMLKANEIISPVLSNKINPNDNVKNLADTFSFTDKLDSCIKPVDKSAVDSNSISNILPLCKKGLEQSVNKHDCVNVSSDLKTTFTIVTTELPVKHKISFENKVSCDETETNSNCEKTRIDSFTGSNRNPKSSVSEVNNRSLVHLGNELAISSVENDQSSSSCFVNNFHNDNDVNNCSNLFNTDLSLSLSTSPLVDVTDDQKCSLSCDIDLDKIINSIASDEECD